MRHEFLESNIGVNLERILTSSINAGRAVQIRRPGWSDLKANSEVSFSPLTRAKYGVNLPGLRVTFDCGQFSSACWGENGFEVARTAYTFTRDIDKIEQRVQRSECLGSC